MAIFKFRGSVYPHPSNRDAYSENLAVTLIPKIRPPPSMERFLVV